MPAEYQSKLTALATVIDAAGPDVVALQEVGPPEVLADLDQACQIDFDHRLVGKETAETSGADVDAPLDAQACVPPVPPGVLPVQCRDGIFNPERPWRRAAGFCRHVSSRAVRRSPS